MGAVIRVNKTAVVLFNLGGPSSREEIKPFLFNLFYDPAIVTLPNPLRYGVAHLISRRRLKKAHHIYEHLGGSSPLLKNTKAQALALETELGKGFRVFVGMRYAKPLISETVKEVLAYDPQHIVLLPLYPQFSTTTTNSSLKEWKRVAKGSKIPTREICCYPLEEGFLKALSELTLSAYKEAQAYGNPRVLLTAHGLPKKTIQRGDLYQRQVEETAKGLIEKLDIPLLDFCICYQSRVGPREWIGPSTEEEIRRASKEKRPLVVVPLSFVSEHSETLVELDILYRTLALQEGCPSYHRVETVQTHPSFIKGLVNLVKGTTLPSCHSFEGRCYPEEKTSAL